MIRSTSHTNRQLLFCLTFLLSFFASQSSYADDLEIYEAIFNAQATAGNTSNDPNVLFILDNSLSMDDYRLIQEGPAGPANVYDPDAIYGSSGRNNNVYLYSTNLVYTGVVISSAQNDCQAARDSFTANPTLPIHQDQYIQWSRFNNGRYGWTLSYFNSNNSKRSFECEDDNGVHGRTSGSNNKYPRVCSAGQGSCTSNSGNALYRRNQQYRSGAEWPYDFFSSQMIMVDGNYHEFLLEQQVAESADVSNCSFNDEILIDAATSTQYRCLQKLEIMKRALVNVVEGDVNDPDQNGVFGINLGLMRFNYNANYNGTTRHGGTIVDAVEPASDLTATPFDSATRTNRDDFIDKVEDMQFEGNTPLAESMYEAYKYFDGTTPVNAEGLPRISGQDVLDSRAVVDGFVGSTVTDETYKTPLTTNQCQGNYVVLLSDGEPTADDDFSGSSHIGGLPGIESCGGTDNCLDEVTRVLKDNLGVNTFTIGFDADIDVLKDAAREGSPNSNPADGDGYFLAEDLDGLESVFSRILSEIQSIENDTFTAPAIAVSAFNRLQAENDIYYAVFAPETHPRWNGNIKKYKVAFSSETITETDGSTTVVLTPEIQDANGINAVSPDTGFFSDESQSLWSADADGPVVAEGGAAGELLVPRNLFASLDESTTTVTAFGNANIDTAVTNLANAVEGLDSTGAIIGALDTASGVLDGLAAAIFGGGTIDSLSENVEQIIRWTLGEDVELALGGLPTDPNKYLAENLHSSPAIIAYGSSADTPKEVLFLATNQGLLHAITARDQSETGGSIGAVGGSERWAYLPDPDLLKNLGGYYNKELDGSLDHVYGLDAELTIDVERTAEGQIDHARLYMGQRRGGNKYFGLDVTNGYSLTNPLSKLWTIEGGSGDFVAMGQTWAKALPTKLRVCASGTCALQDVVVLTGGYDELYDDRNEDVADLSGTVKGNAIYIVDALTGALLWKASSSAARSGFDDVVVSEMTHSIPSAPTVLDLNKDGGIDVIFAIDIAGQVFRFDFRSNTGQTDEIITGARIADLQETNINRRFYNPLDAVVLPKTDDGAENRIALVTGSGYRAHPLDVEFSAGTGGNRYYVLYDENIGVPDLVSGSPDYLYVTNETTSVESVITAADLPELTVSSTFAPGSTHKLGYYVALGDSETEKVLSPSLITDGAAFGVTYTPTVGTTNACSAAAGSSSVYQLDLLDGGIASEPLDKPGVSAAPVLAFTLVTSDNGAESVEPIIVIGTKPFGGKIPGGRATKAPDFFKARKQAWWEEGRGDRN